MQRLGHRLSNAATSHESSRGSKSRRKAQEELQLKFIMKEIRKLLERIEDAVPLINLAITTSGASLSTALPASVSPSRLLQASMFLNSGDIGYAVQPNESAPVGPAFIVTVYMLFGGHANRQRATVDDDEHDKREMTWKEVMHKARVTLSRIPLEQAYCPKYEETKLHSSSEESGSSFRSASGESRKGGNDYTMPSHSNSAKRTDQYAYQLRIIEDLDDGRVHTFEDHDDQPGPFKGVQLAGIREILPVHQISKIFYANTGKLLNIPTEGEAISPVLLLKRDPYAIPPRQELDVPDESDGSILEASVLSSDIQEQPDLDSYQYKIHDRSPAADMNGQDYTDRVQPSSWRFPNDLDPEWIAFEVYNESDDSSDTETEVDFESETPSSSKKSPSSRSIREELLDPELASAMTQLKITTASSESQEARQRYVNFVPSPNASISSSSLPLPSFAEGIGPVTTTLSLLETLIRLTSLQQFQQRSHLCISDEVLNFFLNESSSTGAGSDHEVRQRRRQEARDKVGFDPYDESPFKHRPSDVKDQVDMDTPSSEGEYSRRRGGSGYNAFDDDTRDSPFLRSSPSYGRSPTVQYGTSERILSTAAQSKAAQITRQSNKVSTLPPGTQLASKNKPERRVLRSYSYSPPAVKETTVLPHWDSRERKVSSTVGLDGASEDEDEGIGTSPSLFTSRRR
jgi:RanGTP-binding protein